jgi:hypothetical protein
MADGSFEVTFMVERETKGAVLYHETVGDKPVSIQEGTIGQVYVRKDKIGEKKPKGYKAVFTPIF